MNNKLFYLCFMLFLLAVAVAFVFVLEKRHTLIQQRYEQTQKSLECSILQSEMTQEEIDKLYGQYPDEIPLTAEEERVFTEIVEKQREILEQELSQIEPINVDFEPIPDIQIEWVRTPDNSHYIEVVK